ncbi:hypothetical protein HYH03_001279 [Edaphochlamys debaryana]|uniref:SET domain-containing protein n=1 Tax=Edaphochlamys debaryana TaxID=47281 RepID=A0A836C4T1_9CHLO|nr:hypothetical protein HYH03_001279 [Edaphochlamys debaryana]|eukprot:KAG2500501.1 hypothetical protein HYH03_001279 [Edaphochlamys debaryana]
MVAHRSLLLFALAAFAATTSLAQDVSNIDVLFDWFRKRGGVANAEAGVNKEGWRGLFAKEKIRANGTILAIPQSLVLNLGRETQPMSVHILRVLKEYKLGNHSRFWPHVATWPKPHEIVQECTMDDKFLPMWKAPYSPRDLRAPNCAVTPACFCSPPPPSARRRAPPWSARCREDVQLGCKRFVARIYADLQHEAGLKGWRALLRRLTKGSLHHELRAALRGQEVHISLKDVTYAAAITGTRYLAAPHRPADVIMLPVFDLANHRPGCPTYFKVDVKSGDLLMKAGEEYQAGDEICYEYGDMTDDYAVSAYGFLPEPRTPPRLAYVDERGFVDRPYEPRKVQPLTGPREALVSELARLEALRANLTATPDPLPRPEGAEAWVWDMFKALEGRRLAALEHEAGRVRALLEAAPAEEGVQGEGKGGEGGVGEAGAGGQGKETGQGQGQDKEL